ncbi:JAB domain-containing protein [Winogradskyella sp.]|uniref:JAB domain-containing protein n=1 Tax=Winogradskyella sp. TaxID=1883156 RepID=UPI002623CF0E|nr:JAB domain-containing protein [Winogradskyella sp.]
MNVRLSKAQKIKVLNSSDIYNVMQQILLRENKIRRNQEHFWVAGLDNSNKILFIELIGLGAVNRVNANPPDIFRMGIYKLAVRLILVHNHPSGNIEPSKADKEFTDKILKVGQLINIEVIDHLVISEAQYTSFADKGIIDDLKTSGLFEVVYSDKKALEEWRIKTEKERTVKLDIAKKMLSKNYDIDTIKEITGLTKWDIRKL